MENSMIELSNENNLNLTPKFLKKNRFNKSPILISNLSKVIKPKANNNYLLNNQIFQKEKEQLILDYHRNSINNNNYRTHLPNIITSLTPIERRNNYKRISVAQKNKSFHGTKNYNSRNFELTNFFENDQLNSTFQLKKFNQMKNNKYYNTHIYSRNIDNMLNKSSLSPNYLTQNNISTTNKNNFNKIKFSLNKKNLMNTIKKPSKINIEKKNLKYKIPIDVINNYNYGKKKILNDVSIEGHNNNSRKLNIKQRNHKSISGISPMKKSKDTNEYNNIDNKNNEKEEININDSKAFIESTLIAFNGLVSQAQELGQILIDNKEMINSKNKSERGESNDLMENNEEDEDNEINVKSKLNKLNQEIKNKNKTVEELQKINLDLNNKINLFNENTQQYENKVKELVTVINQIKNNSNNPSNSNSNNSDNYSNGIIGNNNTIKKESNNNFMLENKPKKKKLKFGFVELIFMKDDKFEMIHKPKPPQYQASKPEFLTINKTHKEPKLVFVNINKNCNNIDNSGGKATNEEYLDAASQMANSIIIESLLSIQNEDEK
jgi:hypothetical protein